MSTSSHATRLPLTANFHFIRACNFRCRYCYATFCDSAQESARNTLPHDDLLALTRLLARRFSKITFAGGEPTLYSRLPELFAVAKSESALVNLVTNGSRISPAWLASQSHQLDFLTLSADSDQPFTLEALGRSTPGKQALHPDHYIALARAARDNGIKVKLNTVVTRLQLDEDLAPFVRALNPLRWKLLQAAPVAGQNDTHIASLTPSRPDFEQFVRRHQAALAATGIRIVPEPVDTIRGSYIMIDPLSRFFDSTTGRHQYSRPILQAGLYQAWSEVAFDREKFLARGGDADFASRTTSH